MNKNLVAIFIFILPFFCFSQEKADAAKRLQGSKELPLELNLLVQTLHQSTMNREDLYRTVMSIDSYARLLNKEDIFLIGKIEIYKTILKSNEVQSRAAIDGDSLKILKAGLKKAQDPFIKWFLQALLHDCNALISSAFFKDYVLQKNNGRLEKLEYRKINKKVQLLYRWIAPMNPDSSDFESSLKAQLVPVLNNALKNIEASFFLMALNSHSGSIPTISKLSELKFFSLAEVKPEKRAAPKEKTVDEILAPITDENQPAGVNLPEPSKEDWLNNDNAPANLKNLPKPSDDADWLQDI